MVLTLLKSRPFWWDVIKMGFTFVIFFTFFEYLMSIFRSDFATFVQNNFAKENLGVFLLSRLVGGLFYGVWITYGKRRKAKYKK